MSQDLFTRDNWIYVEWIVIGGIFLWQLDISVRIYFRIRDFRNIFSVPLNVSLGEVPMVGSRDRGQTTTRIVKALNDYLGSNYQRAINFGIIKDTIDREIEVKDEEITQSIPTPLYLGLAATMIGIILGLLSMPPLSENADNSVFQHGIDALINGVKIAMGASLTGLASTTILSTRFYKLAREVVSNRKNDQLSELQAKLLPELLRADDTGISGLRSSLDRYAAELAGGSEKLMTVANHASNNLHTQLEVIRKLEDLNMSRVARVNLELFKGLEGSLPVFNKFLTALTQIARISENLESFSKRSENLEDIANEIKSALFESKEVSRFLTIHLQKVEAMGEGTLRAVDLSDSHFRQAVERLTANTNARIAELNAKADTADSALRDIFDEIGQKLNEVTAKHLAALESAYVQATPHFVQLDYLAALPEFKEKFMTQSKEQATRLDQLNEELMSLSLKVDHQSLLTKLDSIERSIKNIASIPVSSAQIAGSREETRNRRGFRWRFLRIFLWGSNKKNSREEK